MIAQLTRRRHQNIGPSDSVLGARAARADGVDPHMATRVGSASEYATHVRSLLLSGAARQADHVTCAKDQALGG